MLGSALIFKNNVQETLQWTWYTCVWDNWVQLNASASKTGSASHSLDSYAAIKNRQEACPEHRPTAKAFAVAGIRIGVIQFLGYLYKLLMRVIVPCWFIIRIADSGRRARILRRMTQARASPNSENGFQIEFHGHWACAAAFRRGLHTVGSVESQWAPGKIETRSP
jgi:hypothetical protein